MRVLLLVALLLPVSGCLGPTEPAQGHEAPTAPTEGAPQGWWMGREVQHAFAAEGDVAFQFEFPPGAACDLAVRAATDGSAAFHYVSWLDTPRYSGAAASTPIARLQAGDQSLEIIDVDRPMVKVPDDGPWGDGFMFTVAFSGVQNQGRPGRVVVELECEDVRPMRVRTAMDAVVVQPGTMDEGVQVDTGAGGGVTVAGRQSFAMVDAPYVRSYGGSPLTHLAVEGPDGEVTLTWEFQRPEPGPWPAGAYQVRLDHVGPTAATSFFVVFAPFGPWAGPEVLGLDA